MVLLRIFYLWSFLIGIFFMRIFFWSIFVVERRIFMV